MTATNKQPGRHKIETLRHRIEKLLPWHATGTLSRCDADRVEQALAGDRKLARRYELVRRELAETTRPNETLGAPSARAMEKLFAAINAEEARAPRRRRRPISRTRFLNSARDGACEKPNQSDEQREHSLATRELCTCCERPSSRRAAAQQRDVLLLP